MTNGLFEKNRRKYFIRLSLYSKKMLNKCCFGAGIVSFVLINLVSALYFKVMGCESVSALSIM